MPENKLLENSFPQMLPEKQLKSGNRGCVWLVRDRETRQRYIFRFFTGSGEVYRKLLNVQCPHLPRICRVKEEHGSVFVLEEYVQGDTLAFLLETGPLPRDLARSIAAQVCQALTVLHSFGGVHRDVKPENILIRGCDAVLIDFDASRICKDTSPADTRVMGTTGYAAPEQYGFSQTDARADIYALGIVLNEMLTGLHPSRQLVSGRFRGIVEKCTRINAEQRYRSAQELLDALNATRRKTPLLLLLLLPVALAALLWALLTPHQPPAETTAPTQLQTQPETQETTQPPTEAPTQPPTEPPTEEPTLPSIRALHSGIRFSEEPWPGKPESRPYDFYCDMDGDGKEEAYRYCLMAENLPPDSWGTSDTTSSSLDHIHERRVHACVLRVLPDGSLEIATEFAEYLTDTELTVYRVNDLLSPKPTMWPAHHQWPAYTVIVFDPLQSGTWLYEVSSKFGDQQLRATFTSTFLFQ